MDWGAIRRVVRWPLLWTACLLAAALAYGDIDHPPDLDSYYHAAVARKMAATGGPVSGLSELRFSTARDAYSDKELLLHAFLAPLVGEQGPVDGALKLAGALLGALLLIVVTTAAASAGAAHAWTALPILLGSYFTVRFVMVRPHLLSVTVLLLGAIAIVRRRAGLAAACAAIHVWCHVSFHLLPGLAIGASVLRRLLKWGRQSPDRPDRPDRPDLRTPLLVVVGAAAGLALHPHASDLLNNWVRHNLGVLSAAWGMAAAQADLARELRPLPLSEWLLEGLSVHVLYGAGLAHLASRRRQAPSDAIVLSAMTLPFLGLSLLSRRFFELYAPFAVVAGLWSLRDAGPRLRLWVPVIAAVIGLTTIAREGPVRGFLTVAGLPPPMSREVADAVARQVPPGASIVTCGWDYTGLLMIELPGRGLIAALDPNHVEDPVARHALAVWSGHANAPDPLHLVSGVLDSDYVLCRRDWPAPPGLERLKADPRVVPLIDGEDDPWFLWRVRRGS